MVVGQCEIKYISKFNFDTLRSVELKNNYGFYMAPRSFNVRVFYKHVYHD